MATVHSKTYLDAFLNWEIGTTFPAAPATIYVGLLTAMPTTNTGTGMTEVSGGSYARVAITSSFGAITTLGDNVTESVANNAAINFATPTATWGTVVGFVITTSLAGALTTGSNWIRASSLTGTAPTITSGESVSFPIGDLVRQAV